MKVSIIIPVYNGEKYLDRCLNSVLKQDFMDFEVICINDGSTDNSLNILKKYAAKDNRIKVYTQNNIGVAKTRNKAITIAKGDYLLFIDNDDFIDADYISTYLASALSNNADIVLGGFKRISNNTGKILYKEILKNTYYSRFIILTPWARLIRRQFIVDNDVKYFSYGIGEDVYFNLVLYSKNPILNIINYIGYNQSYNENSVSNTKQKGLNKNIDCRILLNEIKKYYNGNEDQYINFFYHKYIIWYLLFSGRNATRQDFIQEYKKLFLWEKENVKAKIISPFSKLVKGEYIKTKIIIFIFNIIHKCKLIRFFSFFYCRGKK